MYAARSLDIGIPYTHYFNFSLTWNVDLGSTTSLALDPVMALPFHKLLYTLMVFMVLGHWIISIIVLYCIWQGGHCCQTHRDILKVNSASPNLSIRTWICQLNFAQAWGSLTSLKSQTRDPQLKVPPRGLVLRIFMSWKNPSTSASYVLSWKMVTFFLLSYSKSIGTPYIHS